MDDLCCLSPERMTMIATSIAMELASGKKADEILVLRNISNQITQTLYTLYTQTLYLEKNCKNNGDRPDKPPIGTNNPNIINPNVK